MFFPIYFHCIRSFHFLKAVSNSFFRFSLSTSVTYTWVVSLCICIVYVRYTFFRDQLFHTQILSTSVTCLWMISLLILHCIHLLHLFQKVVLSFLSTSRLWVHVLYTCLQPLQTKNSRNYLSTFVYTVTV